MARNDRRNPLEWRQRYELMHIINWYKQPAKDQKDFMKKFAVRSFLDGEDPVPKLIAMGIPGFVAERAVYTARTFIQNERMKRRLRAKEILEERGVLARSFTVENFSVTIDSSQDRNYGMTSVSIYCIVEVWEENEDEVPEKEYLVNFSDYKTKEWLTRLLVWGLMNKREIHILPATDEAMKKMRLFTPRDKEEEA